MIGLLIFGCSLLSALGESLANKIVDKINPLIAILLFHIPSNIMLLCIAKTDTKLAAASFLLIRFFFCQI
jgi:hypothetical protein